MAPRLKIEFELKSNSCPVAKNKTTKARSKQKDQMIGELVISSADCFILFEVKIIENCFKESTWVVHAKTDSVAHAKKITQLCRRDDDDDDDAGDDDNDGKSKEVK